MSHPRAKLTVQGRRLLVERVLELGWSVPMAAEAQGCSAATGYKWIRRFTAEGHQGLHDRSSRPHRSPARLSARREAAIARRQATLEGPHRIAWALGEAPSTVHRVLRRLGAPRLRDLDRPTRVVVRYERERPGELLHVDVTDQRQGRALQPDAQMGVGLRPALRLERITHEGARALAPRLQLPSASYGACREAAHHGLERCPEEAHLGP